MPYSPVEERARQVYVEQHKAYLRDRSIFDRFYNVAVEPSSYGVGPEFFRGKTIVDVGSGNTAYFQKAMVDLGAAHITCLDIGEDWIPELTAALDAVGVPRDKYSCVPGTATALPFPDASFDVVASNGVWMHMGSVELADQAFREHARVTKSGGSLYAYVGSTQSIMDRYLLPAWRQAYQEVPEFRAIIDGLTPERMKNYGARYLQTLAAHDPTVDIAAVGSLLSLFTLDTVTFFQNALQAPTQLGPQLSEAWARTHYEALGFTNVRRVGDRYWRRNDIRKFAAPLHFDHEHPIGRVIYGDGHVKMMGEKLA